MYMYCSRSVVCCQKIRGKLMTLFVVVNWRRSALIRRDETEAKNSPFASSVKQHTCGEKKTLVLVNDRHAPNAPVSMPLEWVTLGLAAQLFCL